MSLQSEVLLVLTDKALFIYDVELWGPDGLLEVVDGLAVLSLSCRRNCRVLLKPSSEQTVKCGY